MSGDPLAFPAFPMSRPAVMADKRLPHQVVLRFEGRHIIVSCNCLRVPAKGGHGSPKYIPLARAVRMDPEEPARVWAEHMAAVGDG